MSKVAIGAYLWVLGFASGIGYMWALRELVR